MVYYIKQTSKCREWSNILLNQSGLGYYSNRAVIVLCFKLILFCMMMKVILYIGYVPTYVHTKHSK